jgi:hypothetical protein
MPRGFGPRLPVEVGSGAATCPLDLDLTSRLRWAPVLPRVPWLWTSPLGRGGLRRCHVSYGSGPRLPAKVSSDAATCPMISDLTSRLRWTLALTHVLWLRTTPPDRGELRRCHVSYGSGPHLSTEVGSSAAMCPAAPCGPWGLSIKKSVTGLPVQRSQCLQGV